MKAVDFLENASVFLLANGLGSSIIQDSDKITFRGDTQFLFTGELEYYQFILLHHFGFDQCNPGHALHVIWGSKSMGTRQ